MELGISEKITRMKKWMLGIAGVLVVGVLLAIVFIDQTPAGRGYQGRDALLRQMRSPNREERKQAAWAAIEYPNQALEEFMVRGVLGDEPEANVREAYVYALGNLGDRRHFAAIETAIDTDPSGFVRASAWLAAARVDPRHFRTLAETRTETQTPWDRLGIAQGLLCLGDVRDLDELFRQARGDDEARRYIASRVLYKWLRPLLDAAGCWPAESDVTSARIWPPEFIDEIEKRCAGLDLQAIADDTRRHDAAAARVRRHVMRITRAREGLVSLLFGE